MKSTAGQLLPLDDIEDEFGDCRSGEERFG